MSCSAINCGNNPQKTPLLQFFRFPKDKQRSAKWVQYSRRSDLRKKSSDYLNKNCRICSNHFEPSQVLPHGRLIWNAVPTLFDVPNPPKRVTPKRKPPTKREFIPQKRFTPVVAPRRYEREDHSYASGQVNSQPEVSCSHNPVQMPDAPPGFDSQESSPRPGLLERISVAHIDDSVGPSGRVPFLSSCKRTFSSMSANDEHDIEKKPKKQERGKKQKNPIDKRLSSKVTELVGHGVSSLQEVKEQLRIFVDTELYPDPGDRPKVTDTTFYPTDQAISTCMDAAKSKMPSNIEIKAHLYDPEQLMALAEQLADKHKTDIMEQVDTFFNCERGRLKLREIVNHPTRPAKLISYVRPDQDGPKHSKFSITEIEDPESLKRTLGMALGVRGVVKKTRTLMMIGQTRLHIDEVEGLGNFMELEVCLEAHQTQEEGAAIAHHLMKQFSIHQSDLISGAYMDLLEL